MKRVLCVRFPNWPVQRLCRELTATTPTAVAIHSPFSESAGLGPGSVAGVDQDIRCVRGMYPAARTGPAVIAVTESAWTRGVRPGLPLAEARSMAQPLTARQTSASAVNDEVIFHEWQPAADRSRLIQLADSLRRFAPGIGLDPQPVPDCLLLDITGCGVLFGGEVVLAEELLRVIHQHGYTARVCGSDTIAAAWAITHTAATPPDRQNHSTDAGQYSRLPISIVPPGQHLDYTAELPVGTARLQPADVSVLSQLGIHTLRQLLSLPREDLPARLSADAVLRIRQYLSLEEEAIQPLPESDPVTADWATEYPVSGHHKLRAVIDRLMDEIAEQLVRRRMGCTEVTCELFSAESAATMITARVVRPVQSGQMLGDVLSLRLESLQFTAAVHRVRLSTNLAPLPVARQKDLFSATEHVVPQDELSDLINRLSGRLGDQSVLTADAHPDPRPEYAVQLNPLVDTPGRRSGPGGASDTLRELVQPLDDSQLPSHPRFRRPIRLLPVPMPLVISEETTDPVDSVFTWAGNRYVIHTTDGPERLQTAWWSEEPVHRDYFVVTTEQAARFWIFQHLPSKAWYLHGIFD